MGTPLVLASWSNARRSRTNELLPRSEPGGFSAISRGLSAATPPGQMNVIPPRPRRGHSPGELKRGHTSYWQMVITHVEAGRNRGVRGEWHLNFCNCLVGHGL
jgi:hypothetical protein